ncbi:MAG: methionine--tRNA ligase [Candidatus Andersenbacteria bacterium]
MPKYYLTTPIYYVNAVPHIGHAYTTIAADVLARWHRAQGDDVLFSTGVDENSQKNVEAAEQHHQEVQTYVDEMAEVWSATFQKLGLSYDVFVRTSSHTHADAVAKMLKVIDTKGDIYIGDYEGYYCVGCEAFKAESELVDGKCPIHGTVPEKIKEQNYFFKLSAYKDKLLKLYEDQSDFVQPASARNKMLYYIEHEMEDISISRQAQEWGIRLPQDPTHAVYVWFDALINYLTVAGYTDDKNKFATFWPADVHLIGKDIIKFHCAIWPAMLMSAGLDLPKKVFAHGFFTINGKKISKSLGNAIDPLELMKEYPLDAIRYFLLRDIPFGSDGDFSAERLKDRYNADLANGLGNLVSRTLTMIEQFHSDFDGTGKCPPVAQAVLQPAVAHLHALAFDRALQNIWEAIAWADGLIEQTKPWQLVKQGNEEKAKEVLRDLYHVLVAVTEKIQPFMPATHEKLKVLLDARPLKKPVEPLFARK